MLLRRKESRAAEASFAGVAIPGGHEEACCRWANGHHKDENRVIYRSLGIVVGSFVDWKNSVSSIASWEK